MPFELRTAANDHTCDKSKPTVSELLDSLVLSIIHEHVWAKGPSSIQREWDLCIPIEQTLLELKRKMQQVMPDVMLLPVVVQTAKATKNSKDDIRFGFQPGGGGDKQRRKKPEWRDGSCEARRCRCVGEGTRGEVGARTGDVAKISGQQGRSSDGTDRDAFQQAREQIEERIRQMKEEEARQAQRLRKEIRRDVEAEMEERIKRMREEEARRATQMREEVRKEVEAEMEERMKQMQEEATQSVEEVLTDLEAEMGRLWSRK